MKIKTQKEKGPPSLARVQPLGGVEVLEVLVISPH